MSTSMSPSPGAAVVLRPLVPDTVGDFAAVANPNHNPKHCWCLANRISGREARELGDGTHGEREGRLRGLAAGDPAPGLVAYADGVPVGWVGFGPRDAQARFARSTVIPHVDDLPVWSVFCLVVRTGHRKRGVTARLLDGVEEYARERGVPALEAYPVEPPPDRRVNGSLAYVGTTGMFERAGYGRVLLTDATSDHLPRWLMRKYLD